MKKKGLLNYIGVDIRKRNCLVCIMDSNGSIIKETNYNNTLEQAESFASSIKRKHGGDSTVVCESTGNLWLKTYQAFAQAYVCCQELTLLDLQESLFQIR